MVTQFRCNAYLYDKIALIPYKYISLCITLCYNLVLTIGLIQECVMLLTTIGLIQECVIHLTDNVFLTTTLYGIVINIFILDHVIL